MRAPVLQGIDHVHIHVNDRAQAQDWYVRVLGLRVDPRYASWATDGGPLTLVDVADTVHLALFERPQSGPSHHAVVALRTSASGFAAWREHLRGVLPKLPSFEDHGLSRSLYFSDPWGNPFEITTCELA